MHWPDASLTFGPFESHFVREVFEEIYKKRSRQLHDSVGRYILVIVTILKRSLRCLKFLDLFRVYGAYFPDARAFHKNIFLAKFYWVLWYSSTPGTRLVV
mmetsp:Transcript_36263/g.74048  ORF Transcript_36263/g.74048 Transcript_36263/m.74048 type:complete len:100 (+) Transcript_36263:385-684(+)